MDGKPVLLFQPGSKFCTRYSTIGSQDPAQFDAPSGADEVPAPAGMIRRLMRLHGHGPTGPRGRSAS
ncbi:hypothetical protein DOU17_09100 [Clavibacter michiganensis subsp. michiganensis]|nr:hypothetical protein [Clavibacter michiganensis subsp. michiganensis]